MRARARVRAVTAPGGTVLQDLRSEAPVGLFRGRPPAPGWAQVWLVGSAGGPLGGDDVELVVEVGPGAALAVGSVAASVAWAGTSPSRTRVLVEVQPGARLRWTPEPVVVTARADHILEVVVDVAAGAELWWRDELLLGRSGERPGRCRLDLRADLGGVPWVRHELAVGEPGWDGAAVLADSCAVGSVLSTEEPHPVGSEVEADNRDAHVPHTAGRVARLSLPAGGSIAMALGPDRSALERLLPAIPRCVAVPIPPDDAPTVPIPPDDAPTVPIPPIPIPAVPIGSSSTMARPSP